MWNECSKLGWRHFIFVQCRYQKRDMVSRCKVQGWGGPNCRMQKTLPMQSKLRLWHFAKHSQSAAKVYVLLSTMNHSCSPSVRFDTCAESGAEALQVRDNALFGTPTSAFVPGQLDHNHTGRGTVNKLRLQFFERGSSNRCRKKWSRTWHAQVGDRLTLAYVAPDWQEPQDTRTI